MLFGVIRPLSAWRGRHCRADPRLRTRHYKAICIDALACGGVSLVTAAIVGVDVVPATGPTAAGIACAILVFAGMVAIDVRHTRPRLQRSEPHALLQAPETRVERGWWVCLSFASGTGEELTWRVVQPALILQWTGSFPLAVAICALTFGIGHIRSGRAWAATTVGFALVFQALVSGLAGGLYLAIAVHVALNLTMGLSAGRWRPQPEVQSGAAL